MRIVVGASMALAMKRLASTAPPSARRTAVARPLRTTTSLTSAPVMTEPPLTSITRSKRVRKTGGAANRQCELHDVGEDEREDNTGARHAFGRYDVHVRSEQRADAAVFEMLAHHAEQVMLGVREELLGLCARQAVFELVDRERRVERDRGEQRAHLHGIEEMQLTERLGVARREPREGSAGLVEVLVDDDAGTVAERRALLDWRLDIREAETVEFQVVDQRRMAESHKKVGVQVKAIACQSRLFRSAAATYVGVSFDDRYF